MAAKVSKFTGKPLFDVDETAAAEPVASPPATKRARKPRAKVEEKPEPAAPISPPAENPGSPLPPVRELNQPYTADRRVHYQRFDVKGRNCPSESYIDRPIHDGDSVRRDCCVCGRLVEFPLWNPRGKWKQ